MKVKITAANPRISSHAALAPRQLPTTLACR